MSDKRTYLREPTDRDFRSPEGFKAVYERYWEKVYAVCYNNTRKVELSQGMTQDIFKSIWERKESLQIRKSMEHYLVRSAKMKVSEYFRNQTIRKKHFDQLAQGVIESTNCTEESVVHSLLIEEITRLVDRLPGQCRKVYKMSREEGLTNNQIAGQLQISVRAVEYHISKALNYLRNNLRRHSVG